jgi:hypothetical protein
MDRGSHVLALVVIDNLDIERIPFAELKADTPAVIDRHGPLLLPCSLQLMQSDASQRTKVLKALGDVQRQQQINRSIDTEPAELVRRMPLPKFAGCSVSPRPDHGIIVLRQTVQSNSRVSLEPWLAGSLPALRPRRHRRFGGAADGHQGRSALCLHLRQGGIRPRGFAGRVGSAIARFRRLPGFFGGFVVDLAQNSASTCDFRVNRFPAGVFPRTQHSR